MQQTLLEILADRSVTDVSTLSSSFQNVVSLVYWSSTTFAPNASNVWSVHFANGYDGAGTKAGLYYVRCERIKFL